MKSVFQIPVAPAADNIKGYLYIPVDANLSGSSAAEDMAPVPTTVYGPFARNFAGSAANQDLSFFAKVPSNVKSGTSTIRYRVHCFITQSASLPSNVGVVFSLSGGVFKRGVVTPGSSVNLITTGLYGSASAWAADANHALNTLRIPIVPNGYVYKATAKVITGALSDVEPVWPTVVGNSINGSTYINNIGIVDHSGTVPGTVACMALGHGMVGETQDVTISGTTNYNGTYSVIPIDQNSFYFTHAYVSDEFAGRASYPGGYITWTCVSSVNAKQGSYLVTGWSDEVSVEEMTASENYLALLLTRLQDHASDTYGQKIGVAGLEISFDITLSL